MINFPSPNHADEDGLLAIGGDLKVETLLSAYKQGIFPWPMGPDIPLPWFSPDPRGVIYTEKLHIPRSLKRSLNKDFTVSFNTQFKEIIHNCAFTYRPKQAGTWITHEIYRAYLELFKVAKAFSVEVLKEDKLVGGLYGVIIGEIVAGESMFSLVPDASKIALVALIRKLQTAGIPLLDTQIISPVVQQLGGQEISRNDFLQHIQNCSTQKSRLQILGS